MSESKYARSVERPVRSAEARARREDRVRNWAAWWNGHDSNSRSQNACGSAERRYVAPHVDDEKHAARNAEQIDVADAEWMESGIKRLSIDESSLLRALYVCASRVNPWRMARKLGITVNDLQQLRERAVDRACVEADRLRDNNGGSVLLIRRGSLLWAGSCKS